LGKGSTFSIVLPLTLAIIDAMIILEGDAKFVVPLAQVHESLRLDAANIRAAAGVGEVLLLRDEVLPLFRLNKLISLPASRNASPDEQMAIVARAGEVSFAVVIDEILEQTQIVIKNLGNELQGLVGFSGSTILGDGRPALILELFDLIKSKMHRRGQSAIRLDEAQSKGVA